MIRAVFALLAVTGLAALKSLPYLPPIKSSSCASVMFKMRNLFLSLSGAFAGILRSASAHIAEHFCRTPRPCSRNFSSGRCHRRSGNRYSSRERRAHQAVHR